MTPLMHSSVTLPFLGSLITHSHMIGLPVTHMHDIVQATVEATHTVTCSRLNKNSIFFVLSEAIPYMTEKLSAFTPFVATVTSCYIPFLS